MILIFDDVADFLEGIPQSDAAKILAHLKFLENNLTEGLTIKPLRGKIKELVVRQYRLVFFFKESTWYIVGAFRKQSRKTPKRIIDRAERIYRDIKS